jgi:hypothetical protein
MEDYKGPLLRTHCFYLSSGSYQGDVGTWDAKGDLVAGLKDKEKAHWQAGKEVQGRKAKWTI